jgi:hypothetical protein
MAMNRSHFILVILALASWSVKKGRERSGAGRYRRTVYPTQIKKGRERSGAAREIYSEI